MNSPKERYILNADIIPNLEDILNVDMGELGEIARSPFGKNVIMVECIMVKQ